MLQKAPFAAAEVKAARCAAEVKAARYARAQPSAARGRNPPRRPRVGRPCCPTASRGWTPGRRSAPKVRGAGRRPPTAPAARGSRRGAACPAPSRCSCCCVGAGWRRRCRGQAEEPPNQVVRALPWRDHGPGWSAAPAASPHLDQARVRRRTPHPHRWAGVDAVEVGAERRVCTGAAPAQGASTGRGRLSPAADGARVQQGWARGGTAIAAAPARRPPWNAAGRPGTVPRR